MEILQPYNNNTLQLISDVEDYQFQSSDLEDGVIKLSVFSDVGSFQDFKDLEEGKDFYVKGDELFLKPNEYLDEVGFSEGNYNLQYDFLKRLNTSAFNISEISPSRKEIRLSIPTVSISTESRNDITEFMNDGEDSYKFNSNLAASDILSLVQGGSQTKLKLTSSTPSSFNILSLTIFGKLSATGQFGEVKVMSIFTFLVSLISILYIKPNS